MFRRILQMREKLEGIIQLQTIKYQRQLALMLRDSKQRQRETELANVLAQGAGAGAVGAPAGKNIVNCGCVVRGDSRIVPYVRRNGTIAVSCAAH
jgi:hypothetical protein